MATSLRIKPKQRTATSLKFVSPEEGHAILDRQTREHLGMSADDFIRRYEAGEIDEPDQPIIARLAMLIPLAG